MVPILILDTYLLFKIYSCWLGNGVLVFTPSILQWILTVGTYPSLKCTYCRENCFNYAFQFKKLEDIHLKFRSNLYPHVPHLDWFRIHAISILLSNSTHAKIQKSVHDSPKRCPLTSSIMKSCSSTLMMLNSWQNLDTIQIN